MEKARGRILGRGRVDRAKVEATTEEDTQRHMIDDGLNPDNPLAGFTPRSKVAEVRQKAAMSQDVFAQALRIPVKTIRNWEQGRSKPDPAARALLAIVDDDPARAFQVIERRMSSLAIDAPKGLPHDSKVLRGTTMRGSPKVLDPVDAVARTTADTVESEPRKL